MRPRPSSRLHRTRPWPPEPHPLRCRHQAWYHGQRCREQRRAASHWWGEKITARKILGTLRWFDVRSRYGFINRNDTKEDVFVHRTATKKNNPRKYLRSVGDGETVELDAVEGEKGAEAANGRGAGGVPVQGGKHAADSNHSRRYPRCRGPPRNY